MASVPEQGTQNVPQMAGIGKQAVGDSDPSVVHRTRSALGDIGNQLLKNGATGGVVIRKKRLGLLPPVTVTMNNPIGKGTSNVSVVNDKPRAIVRTASFDLPKPSSLATRFTRTKSRDELTRTNSMLTTRPKGALGVSKAPGPALVRIEEKTINVVKHTVQHLQPCNSATLTDTATAKPDSKSSETKTEAEAKSKTEGTLEEVVSSLGAFSFQRLQIKDIDAKDEGPFMLKEYIKDISAYLFKHEKKYVIPKNFLAKHGINPRMRAVLMDWMVEVHDQFQFCPETLYLAGKLLDRYLVADESVTRNKLQLVGVACLFVAAKFEEVQTPTIVDFAVVSDNAYSVPEVRAMEKKLLSTLKFDLGVPLPVFFLRRCSKAAGVNIEAHNVAKFFMELALVDYSLIHFFPSQIAAGSLALTLMMMLKKPLTQLWSPVVEHYSGYSASSLKPVLEPLASAVAKIFDESNKFPAVRKKYTSSKYFRASTLPAIKVASWKNFVLTELAKL